MKMAKPKRRKLTKAQAKAEALRRKRQRQITWAVAGVIIVAVVAVLVLITISGGQAAEVVQADPLREDIETGLTEEGYPYRGAADAPVTIVEYSDYNCPHCRDFALETAPVVDDELVATGQVKYVVEPYALWEESVPIVEAAVCASEQGGFWGFHHLVFANQESFSVQRPPSRALLNEMADTSGLDVDLFDVCLDEGREDQVLAATEEAKTRLDVNSTPTFFVNGVRTALRADEEPIETLRRAVEMAQSSSSGE
jgi:protein-disulfide isomerase